MEFDLVQNALHSLSEAISYYNEADENDNADKFKFCVLLTSHCAELLLKEILRKSHPALVYEDIDNIKDISDTDDIQTVGYKTAIKRVKMLCNVKLQQYETYLSELGRVRNKIQHYVCNIDGAYYKNLMSKAFSAIEYLFLDVLKLKFDDYETVIDPYDISFLHEDALAYKTRQEDILTEFNQGSATRYNIIYDHDKKLPPMCPVCGSNLLSHSGEHGIHCKMCGTDFADYKNLCEADSSCINSTHLLRELGRRNGKLYYPTNVCPECDCKAVVFLPQDQTWQCICCAKSFGENWNCDECGAPMPSILSVAAISGFDADDFKHLCQTCAEKAKESEDYFGYNIG